MRGGPDVSWASTEHNLEARAFFAGLDAALSGRPIDPRHVAAAASPASTGSRRARRDALKLQARDAVTRIDRAIDAALFVRDGDGRAHFGQGLDDDARPLDVQALGILWLVGRGRADDARAVERFTDATMRVEGRRVDWPGASGQTFIGYRPFAARRPRRAVAGGHAGDAPGQGPPRQPGRRARRSADRWAALTAPRMPLQVDRAAGEDYHVWPAAAPAAWLAISRSSFALLQ